MPRTSTEAAQEVIIMSLNATHDANEADSTSAGLGTPVGGRLQLALNVSDVDAAVQFYAMLFGVPPTKRRPGYANFAITTPPLKLVLIEDPGARGTGVTGALNHLGVEVPSSAEVGAATARLTGQGLATLAQDATSCCYAVQDKVWVHDPDGPVGGLHRARRCAARHHRRRQRLRHGRRAVRTDGCRRCGAGRSVPRCCPRVCLL